LLADAKNIGANFRDYLNGFSDNVRDVLEQMKFEDQIATMEKGGVLYQVISDFNSSKADMSPDKVATNDMGYIFENLVARFSESYDEQAGAHFTSRDIIYLMCDILTAFGTGSKGASKTVYDMTMGTSQMLTCMEDRLKEVDASVEVTNFGQEFNPFTFGIAKADMLIRGGNPDNMRYGNTLSDDKFSGFKFDYVISNPPFGIDWKVEAKAVEKEAALGDEGRFGVGLPSKSDGQMLFMLNGISKLKDDGRMAIIQNGSSLFSGDAGSGPSEIRRHIIENDWLEAIIQLPNDSFYNTGIATYVWVVTKAKSRERKGKVQLIDASKCCEARRKSIGNKRVDITEAARALIVKAYCAFKTETYKLDGMVCKSHIFVNSAFGFTKIVVESPLVEGGRKVEKKGRVVADTSKRDTENVPLGEDIGEYMKREVLPYNPDAWVDETKSKVGYEIPFTRTFYEYKKIEPSADIAKRIKEHESRLAATLGKLFGEGGK
ncbi:MAG: SAM-dependent DNA methyltransferase, partial [Lentisphaerae bacterium]|nr:SAM-dependent DNA methyltransferase [Lentisphaerota bacterium]